MRHLATTLFGGLIVICAEFGAAADLQAVIVNGTRLTYETRVALQIAYAAVIPAGRYWYDTDSGLWGHEGQPPAGQIRAGLDLGGRLQEQASDGDTAVIVNGRRLPRAELLALQRLVGPVAPGRYWLDGRGNAGFEGGPALVNIIAAHRSAQAASGGDGGWNRNTPGGNWGGDGECSYYSHPDGPSVMIGSC
jgi:hypothetical protein